MLINVDIKKCWTLNMTPSQYVFLYALNKNINEVLIAEADLKQLIEEGYIRRSSTTWILTADGLNLIEQFTNINDNNIDSFVDKYRDLFPKGVKSGNGTPIRGDKQGCTKKMEWFLKTYPEYSFITILEATKKYVEDMRRKNYAFMVQADYFIQKDGASKLAGMCEEWNITNKVTSGDKKF